MVSQELVKIMVSVQPPPLTPPTRGGEKCFLPLSPLTEGEKGGG